MPRYKETLITVEDVSRIADALRAIAEQFDHLSATMTEKKLKTIPAQNMNNKDVAIERMQSAVAGAFRGLAKELMSEASAVGSDSASFKLATQIVGKGRSSRRVAEKGEGYEPPKSSKRKSSRKKKSG